MGLIFYKETARQWRYILPEDVTVRRVRYVERAYPDGLLLFEAPTEQQSYLTMLSTNGHRPATEPEAREYLRRSYEMFHRPCWYVLGNTLLVYPVPVNDAYLVVDTDVQGE